MATNTLRVFQPGYITNPTTQGEHERVELLKQGKEKIHNLLLHTRQEKIECGLRQINKGLKSKDERHLMILLYITFYLLFFVPLQTAN